ncbi:hypothetical protein CROQUDRAFT_99692 [Cronartium quercuum f. sp. fusiforme G11]|uniref:Tetratricopeptide repeat protein n=1 Tax=Cronartium quercuum f. sp. fusiforme G11 TaxID=708437 RepID=A0A9P6N6Y6_9BASI|nr:hypothetical protein CROQUDRAFT_99692 [Cronartium quercuum f. sp. fusiforme G11]
MNEPIKTKTTNQTEIYIPGLTNPSLLTNLPTSDPISNLLTRYLDEQDQQNIKHNQIQREGDGSLIKLMQTHSWSTIASKTRTQILDSDPTQTTHLLELWAIRLQSLTFLNLSTHLSSEIKNLIYTIKQTIKSNKEIFNILPFSIMLLYARLPSILEPNSDFSIIESIEAISSLINISKQKFHQSQKDEEKEIWKDRVHYLSKLIGILLAGQHYDLIKLQQQDSLHLSPFAPELAIEVFKDLKDYDRQLITWIELGDLNQVEKSLLSSSKPSNFESLLNVAKGNWENAIKSFNQTILEFEKVGNDLSNPIYLFNNLAIAYLYEGKLSKALEVIKKTENDNLYSLNEPLIFNHSTILELVCSGSVTSLKIDTLKKIAMEKSLDGLRSEVFKLG